MMMVFIVDHAVTVATGQKLSARGSTASLQLTWSQDVCGWSNVSPDAQRCAAERVGLAAENPWIQATRPAGPEAALTLMACSHVGRAGQVVQDTRGHWLPHLQPWTWSLQLCVRTPMARSSAKRRSGSCWALHHKVRSGKEHTRSLAATPETVDLMAARVTLTFRICLLAKWRSG